MNQCSRVVLLAVFIGLLTASQALRADSRESAILAKADATLAEFASRPFNGLGRAALRNAQAVAIFPGVIKAAAWVGGRHGRGVLFVREPDGSWGPPVFLTLTGASFGNQVGVEGTDMVFMLRTRSLESLQKGKLTLGAGVTLAVGPLGQDKGFGTDLCLKTGIVYTSRSRGLFAGVYAEGARLSIDAAATTAYRQFEEESFQNVGPVCLPSLRLQRKLAELSATPASRQVGPPSRSRSVLFESPAEGEGDGQ